MIYGCMFVGGDFAFAWTTMGGGTGQPGGASGRRGGSHRPQLNQTRHDRLNCDRYRTITPWPSHGRCRAIGGPLSHEWTVVMSVKGSLSG
jgi:hypothetical protein